MRQKRPRTLVVWAAAPVLVLALVAIGEESFQLANPCVIWGAAETGSFVRAPHDPCSERTVTSETKKRAGIRMAVVPGGILLGSVLGVLGTTRKNWKLSFIAGILLLLEAMALVFTLWPLSLLASAAFLWSASGDFRNRT